MSVMKQKDHTDFIAPVNSIEESNTQRVGKINFPGKVQHSKELADNIKNLLMNETCSDVTLVVDDARFPAHKVILAARSKYFWGMFFGGMRESKSSEVHLYDTSAEPFRALLKYVYCGEIELNTLSFELVIDVLGLVHKYSFGDLENAIAEYLKSVLTAENVCTIYAAAYLYSMNNLLAFCAEYCDENATQTLNSPEFNQLSVNALSHLIGRNSFCAPELEIFHAVRRWIEVNENEIFPSDRNKVIQNIRLALIKLDDLLNIVRPSGLIPPDALLDVISDQTSKRNSDQTKRRTSEMGHRGFLVLNTNVATLKKDAKVLSGNCPSSNECGGDRILLDTSSTTTLSRILIELARCYIINHIMFLLADRDQLFSYYVEVSVDNEDWIRVIDHTNYLCRSRQRLYFNERVVKYIRFVGTPNVDNGPLIISDFEASYSTEPFKVDSATTLLIPNHNVATTRNNAIVIEGVSRIRNSLLNGEVQSYDWDYGYTCHELGSSSIIVQLPQPYLIDSARLLLWDCDERCYSYYIEVSCDKVTWTKVCQVVNERSWQILYFNRIPVVFIKIVGTYNSANDVFHCVHFECPAISKVIISEKSSEATSSITSDSKRPSDDPCTSKEAGL